MSLVTIPAKDIWKYIGEPGNVLIDLRKEQEFKKGHIEHAVNIPYQGIEDTAISYDQRYTLIMYCERGNVSLQLGRKLSKLGYHVVNVYGGMHAYRGKIIVEETEQDKIFVDG